MVVSLVVRADLIGDKQYSFSTWETTGAGVPEYLVICGVVPNVIDKIPTYDLFVFHQNGQQVYQANELSQYALRNQPVEVFVFGINQDLQYTILVVNMDAPRTDDPTQQQLLIWGVCNVAGTDLHNGTLTTGDTFASWQSPVSKYGAQRIVYLIYQQPQGSIAPAKINNRANFSSRGFASKNSLGMAVAANFIYLQPETCCDEGSSGYSWGK